MENKEILETNENEEILEETGLKVADDSIEKNVKLMSPMQMVLRRFFRSKLSIIGLIMILSLFAFCWLGPVFYNTWQPDEVDYTPKTDFTKTEIELDA